MRRVLKARWWIVLAWVLIAAVLILTAPSISQLVHDKGTLTVPAGYSSSEAAKLLSSVSAEEGSNRNTSIAIVFHDKQGIGEESKQSVKAAVDRLRSDQNQIGIVTLTDPFSIPEAADKMISKDGTTILVSLSVNQGDRAIEDVEQGINQALDPVQIEHYLTGQELINRDTIVSSEQGLKKSEYFTVIFILLILFVVFRSFVAPFVPLLTVGLSYIISQQIVAFLVDTFSFPISTYTQIFMVAVMFGIGTDYCILLISRFKEELMHTDDVREAIVRTYSAAGKTVIFSCAAVLVGFTAIGLSQFILYRSAAAVAVGVAVMLLALLTVVPFFMALLGKKLFWPARGSLEHKENRFWGAIGSLSLKRPWVALLIVAAVTVPFLISRSGNVSFNSMEEIGSQYDSVKGFNIISDSFEPGESLPTQLVIKNDEKMDNAEYITLAEKISREVSAVKGVSSVRSLSRPTGEEMKEFQLNSQISQVGSGLDQGAAGIDKIQSGLSQAGQQLEDNAPKLQEAVDSTGKLAEGTAKLQDGIAQLKAGLSAIEQGIRSGSAGAGQLKAGAVQMKQSARQLAQAQQQLLASYRQIGQGLGPIGDGVTQLSGQLDELAKSLGSLDERFAALESRYPELAQDMDYLTIHNTVTGAGKGAAGLAAGLSRLSASLTQAANGLNQANAGFAQTESGAQALAGGFDQVIAGLDGLASGLDQAAAGQSRAIGQIPAVTAGLEQIENGQKQLQSGFGQFVGQVSELSGGLKQSADGLSQVAAGLGSATDYLKQAGAVDSSLDGFYVPPEALQSGEIAQLFDTYLSKDRKLMTLDVIFAENPYGTDTLGKIDQIQGAIDRAVQGTPLENAQIGISGVTSTFHDLKQISGEDYTRTVILMLSGIFIVLVLLLRSVIMPLYLIASLVLTFYTSLGVTELIFVNLLGYSGISWATPFFGFVMLIALGVDYSIFLMARFNENREWNVADAMLHAMRNMGTVILSAAVILGGTFASMYPSGVMSMLQIATVVLTGLFLYAVIILPFFVPMMVRVFGTANWWPFHRRPAQSRETGEELGM